MIVVAIVAALMRANASAQQPAPTPAGRNPHWCPDVPAATPPLNKNSPEEWASHREICMNSKHSFLRDHDCGDLCGGARELWERASDAAQAATPEKPPQHWTAEGRTQGQWTALRDHCMALFSEVASAGNSKPLPPFSPSDWKNCYEIFQPPNQPLTYPLSTDKLQGPFPLQGAAKGWGVCRCLPASRHLRLAERLGTVASAATRRIVCALPGMPAR